MAQIISRASNEAHRAHIPKVVGEERQGDIAAELFADTEVDQTVGFVCIL